MATRADIQRIARETIDTPYHHQGRVCGVRGGMDCFGPVIHVAKRIGTIFTDVEGYPRTPREPAPLSALLRLYTEEKGDDRSAVRPGRIGVFWVDRSKRWEQHVGIFTDWSGGGVGLLHCWLISERVVEHALQDKWITRLTNVFEYPGVTE